MKQAFGALAVALALIAGISAVNAMPSDSGSSDFDNVFSSDIG